MGVFAEVVEIRGKYDINLTGGEFDTDVYISTLECNVFALTVMVPISRAIVPLTMYAVARSVCRCVPPPITSFGVKSGFANIVVFAVESSHFPHVDTLRKPASQLYWQVLPPCPVKW